MSTIQLSFSLRVSSSVKTVHLLGSWDNYVGQLPLSKDKHASKSGSWKGTFRFQGNTLAAGQRYWYYYIIDGYHISHNPSEKSTTEPTTGRELNVLDVPKAKSGSSGGKGGSSSSGSSHRSSGKSGSGSSGSSGGSSKSSSSSSSSSGGSGGGLGFFGVKTQSSSSSARAVAKERLKRHSQLDIPKGRPLSVSQIQSPKPQSPHATRHILSGDYDYDELSEQFAAAHLYSNNGGSGGDDAAYLEYYGDYCGGGGDSEDGIDGYDGYNDTYTATAAATTGAGGVVLPKTAKAHAHSKPHGHAGGKPVVVDGGSPLSLSSSDLSYSSDDNSSQSGAHSSLSGYSTPNSDYSSCTCERYGITRKGDRVRIDCGGTRCGYSVSCSSSSGASDSESDLSISPSPSPPPIDARRNGIVYAS